MEMRERPPVVKYLPYELRPVNMEYRNTLIKIKDEGEDFNPEFHDDPLRKVHQHVMRFRMEDGFPLITEREISEKFLRYAIAEIIGFIHGAVTLTELENFGLPKYWWRRWVEKDRVMKGGECIFDLPKDFIGEHLGAASYGGVWGKFPTPDGGSINQWERVIKQMIKHPSALTHRVVNWYPPLTINPDGKRAVVVAPCHGDVQVTLNPATKTLVLDHIQRSGDVPTGVPYNMIHYPAIGMMLAHVLGYTFTHYNHNLVNGHIYERQWEDVDKMLKRRPRKMPTVNLQYELSGDPVADFFGIRPEHFSLEDYHPHPGIKVDTPL